MAASRSAIGLAIGSRMLPLLFLAAAAVVDVAPRNETRWVVRDMSLRDGVVAARTARAAPQEAAGGQAEAVDDAVTGHGLDGEMGTGRREPARGHPAQSGDLVDPD